jgi:hypothetical protein
MEEPELYLVANACSTCTDVIGSHTLLTVPPHPLVPVQLYGGRSLTESIFCTTGLFATSEPKLYLNVVTIVVVRGCVLISDSLLGRCEFEAPCSVLLDPSSGVLLRREHSADAVVVDINMRCPSISSAPTLFVSRASAHADECSRFSWPRLQLWIDVFSLTSPATLPAQEYADKECTIFIAGDADVRVGSTVEQVSTTSVSFRTTKRDAPLYCITPSSYCLGVRLSFADAKEAVAKSTENISAKEDYCRGFYFKPVAVVDV